MNILLIFFALPIAVIIISIALQKIFKNPLLVAAIIFAIFLIVTFVVNDLNFLVAAIAYAIISFLTALITYLICRCLKEQCRENINCCCNNNIMTANTNQNNNGIQTTDGNQLVVTNCNENNNNSFNYQVTSTDGVTARISIVPNNTNNNGCGCNRR